MGLKWSNRTWDIRFQELSSLEHLTSPTPHPTPSRHLLQWCANPNKGVLGGCEELWSVLVSVGLPWILKPCWRRTIFPQPLLTWSLGFCEVGQECTTVVWAQEKIHIFLRPSQLPLAFSHPEVKVRSRPPSHFTWKDDHNDKGVLEVIFFVVPWSTFWNWYETGWHPRIPGVKWKEGGTSFPGTHGIPSEDPDELYPLTAKQHCSLACVWGRRAYLSITKAMVIGFSHIPPPNHDFLHQCSKPDQAKL